MPSFVKIVQKSLKGPAGIALPSRGECDAYWFLVVNATVRFLSYIAL